MKLHNAHPATILDRLGYLLTERQRARLEITAMRSALVKYEEAFDDLFTSCCSNGVFNAWGERVGCTALNDAHHIAKKALRIGGKQ